MLHSANGHAMCNTNVQCPISVEKMSVAAIYLNVHHLLIYASSSSDASLNE